eukprot:TRINITY_DN2121_c0_g1_i1.p3 TRINITY_DN2121_c0_g1~~TRINITY_DN2121_c0_g1_i1.p3  ORF type:complete len:138 (+),score=10.09 TRINITY_DN2121_c0_g1_i1:67-480(+)
MCIRDSINAEYMGQSNFLKKSKLQLIFLSLFIMQAMQAETAPHFQRISIESTNARVIDNRDPANPFNDIIFMCEHASNALPEGYSWSPNDAENFKDEHWAYDLGEHCKKERWIWLRQQLRILAACSCTPSLVDCFAM